MPPDEPRTNAGPPQPTIEQYAGIWDTACLGSPKLRSTNSELHAGYPGRTWWAAEGGFEVRAHVKGYKAVVSGLRDDLVHGKERPMTDYPTNAIVKGDVVVYVTKRYKPKGALPL